MRARPVPRNFISGELAPWLDGIMNDLTRQGARTLENVLVKKRGAVTQRPGTYFVAETKDSTKASVLVPVTIDDDNSYVLEIGDAYIRFYKNHQRITYSGTTTIYEVTSPWSAGDVSTLRCTYVPSEKAMLFAEAGGDYALRKLIWTSDASWALNIAVTHAFEKLVAISDLGQVYRTDDLKTWENDKIDISTSSAKDLRAGGLISLKQNEYLIPDATNNKLYKSPDGIVWTTVGPQSITSPGALDQNKHGTIILGGTGINDIWLSDDGGNSWQQQTAPTGSGVDWQEFGYDRSTEMWFAARSSGVGATSNDGRTWNSGPGPAGASINDLEAYGGFWVSVAANVIATAASATGAWTTRVASTMIHSSVAYGEPGGTPLWIVASRSNTGGYAVTGTLYQSLTGTVFSVVANFAQGITKVVWVRPMFYIFGTGKNYYSYDGAVITTLTEDSFSTLTTDAIRSVMYLEAYNAEWFDTTSHYPMGITSHEGRIVIGPTKADPSTLWGSKVGTISNFHLGEYSNEAFSYKLTGESNVNIKWTMGGLGGLVVGTRTAEGIMLGSPSEGITPNTAQFRWLSTFGSDSLQPVRVGNMVVFIQRGGEIVRGYIPNENAFQSPELTEYADHVTKGGVREIDHQEDPQNIVYFVRNDGQLLALTIDQGVRAWSRYVTDGTVESVAVIPTSGVEDEVWAIVNRTIGGSAKRYVEYFAPIATGSAVSAHYVDCGVNTTSAVTMGIVGGMTHLAGEIVDALINGTRVVGGLTVPASGTITVSPYSGTNIHAGLPYSATIQTMRGDYGSPYGDGAGFNKRTSEILVWVHDSMAVANFGPTPSMISEPIQYSQSAALNTEVARINFPGTWDRDGYIWCVVRDPRPFTMVALSTDNETGDR